jgi:hypothetical protein
MPCGSAQRRVLYVSVKADQLKKNQGWRVRIAPAASHLDPAGRALPPKNEDWIIVRVTGDEVVLDEASVMGLTTKLGLDAIASFTTDRSRSTPGGLQYGLLLLKVQMYIQSDRITYAPCMRPGEPVPPPPPQMKPETAAEQIARLANEQAFIQDTEALATSREAHLAVEENLAELFDHIQRTIANLGSTGLKGEVGYFNRRNIGVNLGSVGAYLEYANPLGRVTAGVLTIRFFGGPVPMPGQMTLNRLSEIGRHTASVIRTPKLNWCWKLQNPTTSIEVAEFVLSELVRLARSHPPRHFLDRPR